MRTVWQYLVCRVALSPPSSDHAPATDTRDAWYSYANSILQCLYFSAPFREQVINFPRRSPPESLLASPDGQPRFVNTVGSASSSSAPAAAAAKLRPPTGPSARAAAGPNSTPTGAGGGSGKDDKDSPDARKKALMAAGPVFGVDYANAPSYGMDESLFTGLKDLFEAMAGSAHARTGVVSPHRFLEMLRRENETFRSSMHQDAHEFLNLLLNNVVDMVEKYQKEAEQDTGAKPAEAPPAAEPAMNGSAHGPLDTRRGVVAPLAAPRSPAVAPPKPATTNARWVHEIFEGTLTSETKCLTCEHASRRDEPFLDLSVDLAQHASVTACLRSFSAEEMLRERDKFFCDRCGGLQEAARRIKVKRLPRILALHLKRFKYTEDLQRLQKLFHRVVYPYHLRLFNTTDDAADPDRLYELYAVVVHIGGGPYHGHYASVIKTPDRGWLLFDDELVEPVDKAYVRNFFGDRPNQACAYVLFYQETTLEAVKREQAAEGPSATATAAATTSATASASAAAAAEKVREAAVGLGLSVKTQDLTPEEVKEPWSALDHSVSAPSATSTASPVSGTTAASTRTITSQTPSSTLRRHNDLTSTPPPKPAKSPVSPAPHHDPYHHLNTLPLSPTSPPLTPRGNPLLPTTNIFAMHHATAATRTADKATQEKAASDKKEKAKEEKERKVAEKEREKVEKEREKAEKERDKADKLLQKTREKERRETAKREAADVRAQLDATRKEEREKESHRRKEPEDGAARPPSSHDAATPLPAADHAHANGTAAGGGGSGGWGTLSRFRHGSKSLKAKPKFWGGGGGGGSAANGSPTPAPTPVAGSSSAVGAASREDSAIDESEAADGLGDDPTTAGVGVGGAEGAKRAHRFSIRKKASALLG